LATEETKKQKRREECNRNTTSSTMCQNKTEGTLKCVKMNKTNTSMLCKPFFKTNLCYKASSQKKHITDKHTHSYTGPTVVTGTGETGFVSLTVKRGWRRFRRRWRERGSGDTF
jgi:hypothetical protein